jgi:hypothetical protein
MWVDTLWSAWIVPWSKQSRELRGFGGHRSPHSLSEIPFSTTASMNDLTCVGDGAIV